MLIRRFILILLLLLTQAGALAHGIDHLSHSPADDQDGAHHEPFCELCLAFVPMGAGMASVPPVWLPQTSIPLFNVVVPTAWPTAIQTAYRNRGPPHLNW